MGGRALLLAEIGDSQLAAVPGCEMTDSPRRTATTVDTANTPPLTACRHPVVVGKVSGRPFSERTAR